MICWKMMMDGSTNKRYSIDLRLKKESGSVTTATMHVMISQQTNNRWPAINISWPESKQQLASMIRILVLGPTEPPACNRTTDGSN